MKRVCAWCHRDLGQTPAENLDEQTVTHGICEDCAKRFLEDEPKCLRDFLDRLGVPVLVLDPVARVLAANSHAQNLLGKALPTTGRLMCGDAIECANAKLPGGCGHTEHCATCTIRNAVLETFATGRPFVRVPAYPDLELGKETKTMCLRISTEKVGESVLLRIDDLREYPGAAPAGD